MFHYIFFKILFIALLAGTLRTYQKAGCDAENIALSCPRGTSISIEIAQYGNTLKGNTYHCYFIHQITLIPINLLKTFYHFHRVKPANFIVIKFKWWWEFFFVVFFRSTCIKECKDLESVHNIKLWKFTNGNVDERDRGRKWERELRKRKTWCSMEIIRWATNSWVWTNWHRKMYLVKAKTTWTRIKCEDATHNEVSDIIIAKILQHFIYRLLLTIYSGFYVHISYIFHISKEIEKKIPHSISTHPTF